MPDRRIDERQLDQFLNDLVSGRADDNAHDLHDEVCQAIRAARALANSPLPAASTARLDAAIETEIARFTADRAEMRTLSLPLARSADESIIARNGRPTLTPRSGSGGAWGLGRSRQALAQLATAAMLLLTLVGSFYAFGPGRPWQREDPAFIPAFSETPAELETDTIPREASQATSIAELVWQSNGGPNLPFIEPGQPAIDPRGNLWVPDRGHSQFLIFAPDGTFLEAWGTPGSGDGEFDFGSEEVEGLAFGGVAFDAAGNIYVADTGNHRIQKFDPDRALVALWGTEGPDQGQFRRPAAIAVDERGHVYVSDSGWGKVEVFDADGGWMATWSGLGTPMGLAIDGSDGRDLDGNGFGAVWIARSGAGVMKFSVEGERLARWSSYGTHDGAFVDATSVAVDTSGRVFVSDLSANRVQVFAPDGALLGSWGGVGDEAGRFRGLRGIVLDQQGNIYVSEDTGKRIQKFRLAPIDP